MDAEVSRLESALAPRYSIEREIGRGGMATVYLAWDLRHDREVAIKVLSLDVSSAIAGERFTREIEIAAKLNHPHILPFHDSGQAAGFLYYVMPYVEGGTLRQRLDRERQLPIEEALRITREVAEALSYAHRQDVLHRDIKPANILLSADHALVSDFGIARAVSEAGGEKLTESGVALGTPGYMSPEQAGGEGELDARSDLYGLACLLFEMLAGQTPYTGPTRQAIVSQHLLAPVPSARALRQTVPVAVDEALHRALAKSPADRFATVDDFMQALESAAATSATRTAEVEWRGVLHRLRPLTAALMVAAAFTVTGVLWSSRTVRGPPLDDSLYAILPFEYESDVAVSLNEVDLFHDALSRWTGLSIADPKRVKELLSARRSDDLTHSASLELARTFGAGRYLRGTVSRLGDSIRVHVGLYDAGATRALLRDESIRLGPDLAGRDSAFAELADRLLLGDLVAEGTDLISGTRSLPARRAFARGQNALREWDLAVAADAFSSAIDYDAGYAEAYLWKALVAAWSGSKRAKWRIDAEQAALGMDDMSVRHRAIARALVAHARDELERACSLWRDLTETLPDDYSAWYGYAHCLARDIAVVPDSTSPSGWSFRTSYHTTLQAYERAFELRPAILGSLRRGSYLSLRRLFKTAGNSRRRGRALSPDTTTFAAAAMWQGDSVAFVPYPLQVLWQHQRPPSTAEQAVQRLRVRLRDVTLGWVNAEPESADAHEALAIAMGMLGELSALDTLRRARELSPGPEDRLRIAGSEVWMQLAFALPAGIDGIRRARELADSILKEDWPAASADPVLLAGLAALTGRGHLAADYAQESAFAEALGAAPALAMVGPRLLVYAAMGGPPDTLSALEERVAAAIDASRPKAERAGARLVWLGRPATLAFPTYRMASVTELARRGDYLLTMQAALADGDTAAVRSGFQWVSEMRRNVLPASLTLDTLYPEAELLVSIGDLQAAADWLDPTLHALPQVSPHVMSHPVQAASLVRAMALRAEIAERLGDNETARRWAAAVLALWSNADPFLERLVASIRQLDS